MTVDEARAAHERMTALAAAEGLDYQLGATRPGNSFMAHRLLHLAGDRGMQNQLKERLLAAYFCEGAAIGDPEVLVAQAGAVGLDPSEVEKVLHSGAYGDEVRADEAEAVEREITGVPFFLVGGRFGIPGAQDADTMLIVLRRAWTALEAGAASPG